MVSTRRKRTGGVPNAIVNFIRGVVRSYEKRNYLKRTTGRHCREKVSDDEGENVRKRGGATERNHPGRVWCNDAGCLVHGGVGGMGHHIEEKENIH